MFKPSTKLFTDHYKAVLLWWIHFVIRVIRVDILSGMFLQPCEHLLRNGWPLGSPVYGVF